MTQKKRLANRVLRQIKQDMSEHDTTALYELLLLCPEECLKQYLPEKQRVLAHITERAIKKEKKEDLLLTALINELN